MLREKPVNRVFILTITLLLVLNYLSSIPLWAYLFPLTIYLITVTYGTVTLSAQYFIPALCRGGKSSGAIAITFDDGPIPGRTDRLLEILQSYNVPAAFFCIGHRIASNQELAMRIHREGHLLGNHSYWHKGTFDFQSAGKIELELLKTDAEIQRAIGLKPNFFRPPYGITNPMVASAVTRGGYKTIGWSVRSFDTISKNRDTLFKRVTQSLKSGDIILFHDYRAITMEILPEFLEHVAAKGLKIVRLDQLLNEKGYA